MKSQLKILRKKEVLEITGLSQSTLSNRIKDGLFPPPISLGARAVGYIEGEIEALMQAMIAEQNRKQIKELVTIILTERKKSGYFRKPCKINVGG